MAAALIKKLNSRAKGFESEAGALGDFLDSIDAESIDSQVPELQCRIESFAETRKHYRSTIEELEGLEQPVDGFCEAFDKKWFQLMGKARLMLQAAIHPVQVTEHNAASVAIKLPDIELPKFSGSYEEWPGFQDSFKALIHHHPTLSNIQRFHYLQGCLQGEPKTFINTIQLSDAGYTIAWTKLQERYQNERFIIKRHIKTLLRLPSVKKDSYVCLRQLLDTIAVTLASLRALKRPVDTWDDLLVEMVAEKLDMQTQKEWEGKYCDTIPTFTNLEAFMHLKCKQLEAVQDQAATQVVEHNPRRALAIKPFTPFCSICGKAHMTYRCDKLVQASVRERIEVVRSKNLCFNCLRKGHGAADCQGLTCRICEGRHHSMLHLPNAEIEARPEERISTTIVAAVASRPSTVLLSTCLTIVHDSSGREHAVRMMLDGGSEVNLITNACAKRLGLATVRCNTPLTVAGGTAAQSNLVASTTLHSRVYSYSTSIEAHLMKTITSPTPSRQINRQSIIIPKNTALADPDFHVPKDIDILIGNGMLYNLYIDGLQVIGGVAFKNTVFGWVLGGHTSHIQPYEDDVLCSSVSHVKLSEIVSRFWEMESYNTVPQPIAEQRCEKLFSQTATRDAMGRFIVALPFKTSPDSMGDSSSSSRQAFFSMERRLVRHPAVYARYRDFMREYRELLDMKPTSGNVLGGYYLPHHCVIKEASLTTKLRVVFNGSAPSSTGVSLNDTLMVGPKQQDELFSIMLRMRCKQYVISADITKMYRQVMVRPDDRKYQRVWWRDDPSAQLVSYELQTVTYGTTSASYLAIKALRETALAAMGTLPLGARACLSDFYVDDLITGADTVDQLRLIRDEVRCVLKGAGFELNKWASNCSGLLAGLEDDNCKSKLIIHDPDATVSALGTSWNTEHDTIAYAYQTPSHTVNTKRAMLSDICKIYDPLGLIGPVLITAKILIQDLWKLKCGWDEPLPQHCLARWEIYVQSLANLSHLSAPRKVIATPGAVIEMHGFADASESAYGACVYLVTIKENVRVSCKLLCAKSRVAPVKAVSIPRLELSAALLLAELTHHVIDAIKLSVSRKYFYSDSKIVLSWIKSESRRFKVFVANRVGEIQGLTNPNDWHHVTTNNNPADIISRGASVSELAVSALWWNGPTFLLQNVPLGVFKPVSDPRELRCTIISRRHTDLIPVYSSFGKTVRVFAYVRRFIDRMRKVKQHGHLAITDLRLARNQVIKTMQGDTFGTEVRDLTSRGRVDKTSKLFCLNPFIDHGGLLRVGGRLQNAGCNYDAKCPIVLPSSHRITTLIIREIHIIQLHSGIQGTLAAVRQSYWPINGRSTTRAIVRNCVKCLRAKPIFNAPMMGVLPLNRIEACRPFLKSGVDYAGPFLIKDGSRRSKRTIKAYVCVFVCFATKAVHLELVSDLTTDAFLAAMNRFIARRGMVAQITSDNATNFCGARNQLRELAQFLLDDTTAATIRNKLTMRHIEWSFIPPRAPHYGGLWEAAVKQVKHHMRRVMSNALLTFEEFYTLLTQIEAVLNSRPITPMSEDPNDLATLTPGHFLIGEPLAGISTPQYYETPTNRLSRWQLLDKLKQTIWQRWSKEYLFELHKRTKWQTGETFVMVGQLVIIKEDNLPPLQWRVGRIVEIHPGRDGITRSATVHTTSGRIKRPVVKLCPLLRDEVQ